MKSFHWGHGIIIFFVLYISYLAVTVISSRSVDHSLVVDDYYQHDIHYQKLYFDASENRNKLNADLSIVIDDNENQLNFEFGKNETGIKGKIVLYRPSNKKLDKSTDFTLKAPESLLRLPTAELNSGKWIMKIRWHDGIREYYKEEDLII